MYQGTEYVITQCQREFRLMALYVRRLAFEPIRPRFPHPASRMRRGGHLAYSSVCTRVCGPRARGGCKCDAVSSAANPAAAKIRLDTYDRRMNIGYDSSRYHTCMHVFNGVTPPGCVEPTCKLGSLACPVGTGMATKLQRIIQYFMLQLFVSRVSFMRGINK